MGDNLLTLAALLSLLRFNAIAVSLVDFYPYSKNVGDAELPHGNDVSSSPIHVHPPVTIFSTTYSILYVNNNGNISPGVALPVFSLDNATVPTISPYHSNVDTTYIAHVWYRLTNNSDLLKRARNDIQMAYPHNILTLEYLLIATWDHVTSPDRGTNKTNTFQAVVAVSGDETYAIFLYVGGLIQRSENVFAGYSAGSDTNVSYSIPGSLSEAILGIVFTSNVNEPGVWIFRLDKEQLVLPEKDTCDLTHPKEPPHCDVDDTGLPQHSYDCSMRYGSCVPFESVDFCDEIYEPKIDYIYIPNNRSEGSLSQLKRHIRKYGEIFIEELKACKSIALRVLCHYYLPPCGRGNQFKPPSAVCKEQCHIIAQECPDEWDNLVKSFQFFRERVESAGLHLINCDFPGLYLEPLPHCCSDLNLNSSYVSGKNRGTHGQMTAGIIIVAVFGAVVVVTGVILIPTILKLRNMKKLKKAKSGNLTDVNLMITQSISNPSGHRSVSTSLTGLVQTMSDDNLLIPESFLSLQNIVGEGEFGVVYRAVLKDLRNTFHSVAVKTLKGLYTASDLKQLAEESQIMAKFDHPNVMNLLGVSISKSKTLLIIMPFMAQGSLLSYLKKHRDELAMSSEDIAESEKQVERNGAKLLSMCLQVAKGMSYLASQRFVHRDLAARNCMIDLNDVIKVADFGLTRDVYSKNYFRQVSAEKEGEEGEGPVKLPVRWMALESLHDGIFTEKTDVWSFGVTCWEVFSLGKNPYPGVDPFSLIRYLERGERLDKPLNEACSQEIYDSIIKQCWIQEPWKRPTFLQLVEVINTTLEKIGGYLDLTIL